MKDNVRDEAFLTVDETEHPKEKFVPGEEFCDGYGIYGTNEEGLFALLYVKEDDSRTVYEIHDGTQAIAADAFAEQTALREVSLPATLRVIPAGALSNSDDWTGMESGIISIRVHPDNPWYFVEGQTFCRRTEEGSCLVRFLGNTECINVSPRWTSVEKGAFYGCKAKWLYFEEADARYELPYENAFFLDEILRGFGRNGKIYDFTEYDSQALREQQNPVRMRMALDRLNQEYCLSADDRGRILDRFRTRLDNVMTAVDEYNAFPELRRMADSGIFTEDNIDEAIELLNLKRQPEMLQYLLNYKNQHFGRKEFDFSI